MVLERKPSSAPLGLCFKPPGRFASGLCSLGESAPKPEVEEADDGKRCGVPGVEGLSRVLKAEPLPPLPGVAGIALVSAAEQQGRGAQ